MSKVAAPQGHADTEVSTATQRRRALERARAIERAAAEQRRLTRHMNAVAARLWAAPRGARAERLER